MYISDLKKIESIKNERKKGIKNMFKNGQQRLCLEISERPGFSIGLGPLSLTMFYSALALFHPI